MVTKYWLFIFKTCFLFLSNAASQYVPRGVMLTNSGDRSSEVNFRIRDKISILFMWKLSWHIDEQYFTVKKTNISIEIRSD